VATATGREKPWRAVAFVPDPTGQTPAGRKRVVAGRAAAKTEAGLARFIARHQDQGHVVDVCHVLALFDQENQP
jgi:hypothetical protein